VQLLLYIVHSIERALPKMNPKMNPKNALSLSIQCRGTCFLSASNFQHFRSLGRGSCLECPAVAPRLVVQSRLTYTRYHYLNMETIFRRIDSLQKKRQTEPPQTTAYQHTTCRPSQNPDPKPFATGSIHRHIKKLPSRESMS
jgi:hypothetical protein